MNWYQIQIARELCLAISHAHTHRRPQQWTFNKLQIKILIIRQRRRRRSQHHPNLIHSCTCSIFYSSAGDWCRQIHRQKAQKKNNRRTKRRHHQSRMMISNDICEFTIRWSASGMNGEKSERKHAFTGSWFNWSNRIRRGRRRCLNQWLTNGKWQKMLAGSHHQRQLNIVRTTQ